MNDSVIQRLADLEKIALQAGFTKADFNTASLFRVIEKFDELTRIDQRMKLEAWHKEELRENRKRLTTIRDARSNKMNEFKMSLLDYYAGLAMQGMLANPKLHDQILKQGQSWIEESAWKVAQAMIKAKETVQPLRHMHLKEFKELSNRTRNALLSEEIETYGQLVDTPALLLTKIVNLGKVGQAEIAKLLERGER
jgi:hypothetical protein